MSAWSVCYSLNRLGYLKHAWDDVLSFKRASRSLAKTGSFLILFGCFFLRCFLECFLGAQRVPKGSPKGSKIDEKEVSKRYLKKDPKKVPKMMIFWTPQCVSSMVNSSKINDFRVLVLGPFWVSFWRCFGSPNGGQSHQKATSKKHQKNDAKMSSN